MTVVAYITSEYPALSHTFISREISALRSKGIKIIPFSVRAMPNSTDEEIPSILGLGWIRCALLALAIAIRLPLRAIGSWGLALRHRAPGIRGLLWAQFHFVEALAFAHMLRKEGADRIHSHFANSGATVAMLAAHQLRLPWSLTLHGISELDGVAGILLPAKLENAEFVACASWFMRAQAMRLSPPELWPKFHIVRCGIELTELPMPSTVDSSVPTRLVTVGRLSPEKGYAGLFEAVEKLICSGSDCELTVVGDGPLRMDLDRYIKESGLSGRIKLLGALPAPQTLAMIAQGEIFVLGSLMEGLPVVLMEALALGKPVIAPAVAGIPELVADGCNGSLYRPGDWEQLAQKIGDMIHDGSARLQMAGRARKSVAREYDINIAVEPLAVLFRRPARGWV